MSHLELRVPSALRDTIIVNPRVSSTLELDIRIRRQPRRGDEVAAIFVNGHLRQRLRGAEGRLHLPQLRSRCGWAAQATAPAEPWPQGVQVWSGWNG
jgi:hypothetical protein